MVAHSDLLWYNIAVAIAAATANWVVVDNSLGREEAAAAAVAADAVVGPC